MKKTKLCLVAAVVLVLCANICLLSKETIEPIAVLLDNIEALTDNEAGGGGEPTCAAGGCYATSCEFEGSLEAWGFGTSYKNAVTCEGAWACCFKTAYCFNKNKC